MLEFIMKEIIDSGDETELEARDLHIDSGTVRSEIDCCLHWSYSATVSASVDRCDLKITSVEINRLSGIASLRLILLVKVSNLYELDNMNYVIKSWTSNPVFNIYALFRIWFLFADCRLFSNSSIPYVVITVLSSHYKFLKPLSDYDPIIFNMFCWLWANHLPVSTVAHEQTSLSRAETSRFYIISVSHPQCFSESWFHAPCRCISLQSQKWCYKRNLPVVVCEKYQRRFFLF